MKIKYTCKKIETLPAYLIYPGKNMGLYATPFIITVNNRAFFKGDIIIINNEELWVKEESFQLSDNYGYLVTMLDTVKTVSFQPGDIVKKLCSSKEKH